MSKILLIDNYDSFTYNLYHYVSSFNKNVDVKRNDKVNSKDIINGCNENEVRFTNKAHKNIGFFEKFFKLFG